MFVSKLKRQYFTYFLFALGVGIFNIIESFQEFDFSRLVVNIFMVFTFAFLLYCVGFCVGMFIKRIRTNQKTTI